MRFLCLAVFFAGISSASESYSSSLTVRDIQLQGGLSARIVLDGVLPKGGVELDYVRDNVQFSLLNSTIYPAKIIHAEGDSPKSFTKVFAYQYAPNLVRIRFTVDGQADALKGKIKMLPKGKSLEIIFPQPTEEMVRTESSEKEAGLLSKVLGGSSSREAEADSKVEKVSEKPKAKASLGVKKTDLGRQNTGPSAFRSLGSMALVVGGLGMVLLYVKRSKNKGGQARKAGDSWLKGLLSGGSRERSYIEVLANHALGPKQSITVVRIRDQQFVLGVTQDSVQLITQIDSEETDLDVLEDPKVADSIGKMFGAPVKKNLGGGQTPSFENLLKSSSGAGAIVARSAYQAQASGTSPIEAAIGFQSPRAEHASAGAGVRDQIRKRLQGMKQV